MSVTTEASGVPQLDFVTGGLPPNGLTMIVGPPGTGKTVLAMQIAVHEARSGRDVVFLSLYSEPHEKLIEHMRNFTFFDAGLIGERIELISLKAVLREGAEETLSAILQTIRSKHHPLLVMDGYRGLRTFVGAESAQEMIATLSSQMPYHQASCIVASESNPDDAGQYPELASADAIIALENARRGVRTMRTIEVLKMRGHGFLEGIHSMDITADGIEIYPRLASAIPRDEPSFEGKRLKFDLPEFDRMLGGGIPQYSSTTIIGEPGVGKTTFALQFIIAGANAEEQGLYVTLQEPTPGLRQKARELGLGLEGAMANGWVQILHEAPVEIHPDMFAWRIRQLVEERGVQRIVIDGTTHLERMASLVGSATDYLAALGEYLWRSGVTILMIQDRPLSPEDPYGNGTSFRIAQNRIILRRVEYRTKLYRICSILNMQTSDHDTGIHEYRIGEGGIKILQPAESEPGVLSGIAREMPVHEP